MPLGVARGISTGRPLMKYPHMSDELVAHATDFVRTMGGMALELLLVVSERRSGSTQLSEWLARGLACSVELGEPLLQRASAGGYERFDWSTELDLVLAGRRADAAMAWLRHVRSLACAHRSVACADEPCVAVAKLLRHHEIGTTALHELLGAPGVGAIVLERDAAETACSLHWALRSADWANSPSERLRSGRDADYATFAQSCVARGPSAEYARQHAEWFRTVRAAAARSYDLSFANATTMVRARDGAEPRRVARVPVPTLALATIVARVPDRFDQWMRHHLGMGADEIFVYWQVPAVPHASDRRLRSYRVDEAVAEGGGRTWWLAWRACRPCCREGAQTRDAPDHPAMCERRMLMPQQALCARHALRRARSEWFLSIDGDEFLVPGVGVTSDWRAYLRTLRARARAPGGIKVPQLQMASKRSHRAACAHAWAEHKALVRRVAVHRAPSAYGSVHEVTLARGETYVDAPAHVLALLHYRHDGWKGRTNDLGCNASVTPFVGAERAGGIM